MTLPTADVLDSIPDPFHDPNVPRFSSCSNCGGQIPATWFDPGRADFRPRWVDGGERCGACQAGYDTAKARGEAADASRRAGVPPLLAWATRAKHRLRQRDDEDADAFLWRLAGEPTETLGLHAGNVEAWRKLWQYVPAHGSVWLMGEPGTGKSHLAAAIANDLLAKPVGFEAVTDARGERRVKVRNGYSVLWWSEEDFHADMRQHAGERDREKTPPIERAARAGLVILDDLGASKSPAAWLLDSFSYLVDVRYRENKPMIFTSNTTPEGLEQRYGARVASRIAAMVGGRRYELAGVSMRRLGVLRGQPEERL